MFARCDFCVESASLPPDIIGRGRGVEKDIYCFRGLPAIVIGCEGRMRGVSDTSLFCGSSNGASLKNIHVCMHIHKYTYLRIFIYVCSTTTFIVRPIQIFSWVSPLHTIHIRIFNRRNSSRSSRKENKEMWKLICE